MKNPYYRVWLAICFATLMSVQGYAQNKETASRLATYFSPGTTDVISPDDDGLSAVGYCSNLSTSLTTVTRYLRTVISVRPLLPNIFPDNSPYYPKTATK